ncbi:MFS transporter [uncultured Corynebacterium sp.]|uniref:MFS transporter n=1 Tax=uncultured Corynebacterium sp. TaxID=159447 RepID=UPI0025E95301|nr:MFS transporter [uncultured Corynebacterium sp.]
MSRGFLGSALLFASNGAIFASLLPWYPTLVAEWGLTGPQFGFMVAAMPLGSLASSALPARIVARRGALFASVGGTVIMAAVMTAIGQISGGAALAALLFLFGICDATADVGQNVAGTRVQERSGKSIISRLHAFWSLGAASGGAIATWSAVADNDFGLHLAVASATCLAMAALGAWLVGDGAAAPRNELDDAPAGGANVDDGANPAKARGPAMRSALLAVLPLAAVAIAGTAVEDLGQNWGGLAANQLAGVAAASAGVTYTVFLASQTVGRFLGDAFIDRFGRARVAGTGGGLVAVGGALVLLGAATSTPAVLIGGFASAGFGCATLVPSAFAAAARVPGVSDGAGVTLVGWLMRVGFLVTSPAIGVAAAGVGLQWALSLLLVLGLVAAACSPALRVGSGREKAAPAG